MNKKIIIYQIFTRLFGNRNDTCKPYGTIAENGVGKMDDINTSTLKRIKALGCTHIWYTGVIRHATATDYSADGIPKQHPAIVKGKAGSPYAITDYYDIDPDIATNVEKRMAEFEALVLRTHRAGLKVVIDFVPNHVARQYQSIMKPEGVKDLGEEDCSDKHFDINNNFYYCPGEAFAPSIDLLGGEQEPYSEFPAKATGNDCFGNAPSVNDWYETVKLNYGIDYCDAGGRSEHFEPIPSTWKKMTDILLYWADKGVDAFRCDMAEMVPTAFWNYAIKAVHRKYPLLLFIGEVYNPMQYQSYLDSGFDYLYDKVGMYDCIRDVIGNRRSAEEITRQWQATDTMKSKMLYFLENHDEQRIASDYFCGDGLKAFPGAVVSALLLGNPFMLYFGQEFGERGMNAEGFSGRDGRTTIFDYWHMDNIIRGYYKRGALNSSEKTLQEKYATLFHIATHEKAIAMGAFFDLMYANPLTSVFNPHRQYAFLRVFRKEVLLIVANFSDTEVQCSINIPQHAFEVLQLSEGMVDATDLLTGETLSQMFSSTAPFRMRMSGNTARVYKFNV